MLILLALGACDREVGLNEVDETAPGDTEEISDETGDSEETDTAPDTGGETAETGGETGETGDTDPAPELDPCQERLTNTDPKLPAYPVFPFTDGRDYEVLVVKFTGMLECGTVVWISTVGGPDEWLISTAVIVENPRTGEFEAHIPVEQVDEYGASTFATSDLGTGSGPDDYGFWWYSGNALDGWAALEADLASFHYEVTGARDDGNAKLEVVSEGPY